MKPPEFVRIDSMASRLPPVGPLVKVGIGDDCAVLQCSDGDLVLSTDALVEGIHFPAAPPWERVGYRAMAATVSDIAAMGARPLWFVLSTAFPKGFSGQQVTALYDGIARCARQFGFDVVGGDTCATVGPVVLSVTGVGRMASPQLRPLLRNGARPGDVVMVTGTLGDSAAGLTLLQAASARKASSTDLAGLDPLAADHLIRRYYEPTPRVQEGLILAALPGIRALMDVSDGVGQDLGHICRQSKVRAVISGAALPLSPPLRQIQQQGAAQAHQVRRWQLTGGEDFELLVTLAPEAVEPFQAACQEQGLMPPTVIGRIEAGEGVILEETGENLESSGYGHEV